MTAPVALITGVAGQDGTYLAERLLADGYAVHGLVRQVDDRRFVPDGVQQHVGDLADRDGLRALIRDLEPHEVVNLGGLTSVAASWDHPELTMDVSGTAAVALMEACLGLQQRSGRPVRFLQAASAEIFGEPEASPQDETTPLAPHNPYGVAKTMAHLATGVYRARGLFASSLILYNHESPRRPVSFVTRKITAGVAAIANGHADRLVLGNLEARRDWGWAPDYVDAMVRALRHGIPDVFVIATGVSHTVRDFVAAAFASVGIDDWTPLVQVDPALIRPADATELRGRADKAHRELGWRPTLGFGELVAAMVAADLEAVAP